LPYLIAVALIDHTVMPAQCAPRRVQRTDVQTLLCRVTVKALPAFSRRFPTELPSRVIVTLHDGRVVANELSDYQGLLGPSHAAADVGRRTCEVHRAYHKSRGRFLDRPKSRQLCTSSRH
jgi:2-methylcitrate dehydratase PrpD